MTKFSSISFTMADVVKMVVFVVTIGSAYLGLVIEIRDGRENHNMLAYRVSLIEKHLGLTVLKEDNTVPKRMAMNFPVKTWIVQEPKLQIETEIRW